MSKWNDKWKKLFFEHNFYYYLEGCEVLRRFLCSVIFKFRTHKNKINFQPNDKVCCTKNGYVSEKDKEHAHKEIMSDTAGASRHLFGTQKKDQAEGKKERLCNGEIFFIKAVLEFCYILLLFDNVKSYILNRTFAFWNVAFWNSLTNAFILEESVI